VQIGDFGDIFNVEVIWRAITRKDAASDEHALVLGHFISTVPNHQVIIKEPEHFTVNIVPESLHMAEDCQPMEADNVPLDVQIEQVESLTLSSIVLQSVQSDTDGQNIVQSEHLVLEPPADERRITTFDELLLSSEERVAQKSQRLVTRSESPQ
jgi:hypothetical protein